MQRNILLNIGKFSTKSWNQTQTKMGFSRFFWKPWSYTQSIDKSITVIWYIRRITNEEMCCWKIIPLENVSIVDAWTAHRYVSSILATLKEKLFLQRTPPNHCFWQKTWKIKTWIYRQEKYLSNHQCTWWCYVNHFPLFLFLLSHY